MADDQFQLGSGSGSWWDTSRNRYDVGTTTPPAASISTTLNAIASFGWQSEMADMKSRSSPPSSGGSMVCHDESAAAPGGGGGVLVNPNLQMMGLGLSNSHNMDWNQALLSEKGEGSTFRSLLHEDLSSNSGNFQQESLYSTGGSSENEFKQINRGFSLDQPAQFSPNDTKITPHSAFQVDSAAAYGLLLSENQPPPPYQNRPILHYPYPTSGGYSANAAEMIPSLNKYPQFLRTSPPKQTADASRNHLQFTNNTPFWNASAPPPAMADARSSFFPTQIPAAQPFDEKPKNKSSEFRDLSATTKKNNTETPNKRPRNETPSPLPAFKVRKEKMGDRITALQQLVSPFGKTDTASVLSEAIDCIKFLHGQVSALTAPYMKNGSLMHNQQNCDKSKDSEGPRQVLRSRGLCLVPVSSTFPVTHETSPVNFGPLHFVELSDKQQSWNPFSYSSSRSDQT